MLSSWCLRTYLAISYSLSTEFSCQGHDRVPRDLHPVLLCIAPVGVQPKECARERHTDRRFCSESAESSESLLRSKTFCRRITDALHIAECTTAITQHATHDTQHLFKDMRRKNRAQISHSIFYVSHTHTRSRTPVRQWAFFDRFKNWTEQVSHLHADPKLRG